MNRCYSYPQLNGITKLLTPFHVITQLLVCYYQAAMQIFFSIKAWLHDAVSWRLV